MYAKKLYLFLLLMIVSGVVHAQTTPDLFEVIGGAEGNNVHTILYAAIDNKRRFHPIGMVKVKLKADVIASTPAVIPGDFADPSIIKVNNTYYAAGTSSEWAPHFPLFTSNDMVHWKQLGYIFRQKPEWTASSFWAPELFYHRNTFYAYYVAKRKSDGVSCIGVATATDPAKGFTDHGVIIEFGKEAIDPFVINDNGQLYITFKAYGLDKRPIELLGMKLSADGLKTEGQPFSLLRDDPRIGMEGQALIKKDNYYYLFYSTGNCCGINCSYQVRVARATSIKGPYTNYAANPILSEEKDWKCPGHGTLVQSGSGWNYLYHAYSKQDSVFTGRQGMMAGVAWDAKTGWPYFKNKGIPAAISQWNIHDDFNSAQLPLHWQWDFRHSIPIVKLEKGFLFLSGSSDSLNHTGTALTVRPVSGDYELNTSVVNKNGALKGLVLYGDANQSAGIGIAGKMVQLWEVKNDRRSILVQQPCTASSVRLKMVVRDGYQCRFYYSVSNDQWIEMKTPGSEYYDGRHLPPWDRSPRPGLLHYGYSDDPAAFSFFSISY